MPVAPSGKSPFLGPYSQWEATRFWHRLAHFFLAPIGTLLARVGTYYFLVLRFDHHSTVPGTVNSPLDYFKPGGGGEAPYKYPLE